MSTTTTVLFKTDKKLKAQAQATAKKMGIPFSAAMNRLMQEFVERQEIKFDTKPLKPTPYLERILKQGERDLKTRKNLKYFNNVDEMFDDLERRIAKKK